MSAVSWVQIVPLSSGVFLLIDGATGQSETSGSVLERSVRCAEAFKALGLRRGDVIVLMAPNHLDLCIPMYAALYLGVAIAPIDRTLGINELGHFFINDEPKLVFCQSEKANDVRTALKNCKMECKVVTFDREEVGVENTINFEDFLKKYADDSNVDNFKPSHFDSEETTSFLISTSGSSGFPKQTISTHKNWTIGLATVWSSEFKFPHPTRMSMLVSPLQWGSGPISLILSAMLRYTRLQSSKEIDQNHAYFLINTYKPTDLFISPTLLATLFNSSKGNCDDWTSFERIIIAGAVVSEELLNKIKECIPNVQAVNSYGMSELNSFAFSLDNRSTPRSLGKPFGHLQYRLIDVDTKSDIMGPNIPGELWMKGPSVIKGYCKNPEADRESFEDGWYKTGDLIYRDEHFNFFFVDRLKMLLKYRNHQVSPAEVQLVIAGHPGVSDVAVTGIPDYECGDLPVACVVRRPGSNVSAQEIKDLVKKNLTDTKQLRGGVIFVEALPMTAGGKVDNKKLKEIVLKADRE